MDQPQVVAALDGHAGGQQTWIPGRRVAPHPARMLRLLAPGHLCGQLIGTERAARDLRPRRVELDQHGRAALRPPEHAPGGADRKSTRLNSSHVAISYAVFCLKKKKTNDNT